MYEYPAVDLMGFENRFWLGASLTYWVVTASLVLFSVGHFWHSLRGKPRSKRMVASWFAGLLLEFVLLIVIKFTPMRGNDYDAHILAGFLAASVCGMVSLCHCVITVSTENRSVASDAVRVLSTAGGLCAAAALIAMMSVPATRVSRGASRRSQCKNNLKQIGLAFHNNAEGSDRFVDSAVSYGDQPPRSWRVELLPYIDEAMLYHKYDRADAWDSEANRSFARHRIPTYTCPALPKELSHDEQEQYFTAYATVNGPQTLFPDGHGLKMKDVSDGASNTVLVVEACGQQILWSKPQDISQSPQNIGVNLPSNSRNTSPATWSSFHSGGAHTLLADGSVRFISEQADPQVLAALLTATGGEKIDDF